MCYGKIESGNNPLKLTETLKRDTFFDTRQMIKHKFYLRKDIKTLDGLHHVFLDIAYNGNRIRIPIQGVKVKVKHWSSEGQRVKRPNKGEPYNFFQEFNVRIESFEGAIAEIKKTVLIHNTRLSDAFILERLRNPNKLKVDKREFFAVVDEYIDMTKSVKARNTIKGAVSSFAFLKNYSLEKKRDLNFEEMDQHFFETFRKYAFEEKEIGDNYFAKIIASLKAFMSWSHDKGFHSNLAYKKFKAPERETEVIYLTIEELFKLYNFQFESRKLSHVRDFYCFGCFTGLRFSDLASLKSSEIKGDFIIKNIQKTQEVDQKIPLSNYAKAILEKYSDTVHEPLPKISHQKFNDYIKDCCELAGIDSLITIVRFSGSRRIESTHKKCEIITSHTARKTFVTNSLILGMKEMVIRNITGHKKEENFKRYVRIADTIKQSEISNTWDRIEVSEFR